LRRFFEPLIREASERQSKREAGADREDGRHFRLIDRLLSTITGTICYHLSMRMLLIVTGRRGTTDQLTNVLLAARDTVSLSPEHKPKPADLGRLLLCSRT
jgi:hypothetical protein